jgi:hypothetical protein
MTIILEQSNEDCAIQKRVARVQAFASKLGFNLGKEQKAPSLAINQLYAVEYTNILASSPPRLRDGGTFLDEIRTARLSDSTCRHVALFSSPLPVITAALEAAESELAKAEEASKLTEGCQLQKDVEALQARAGELLKEGKVQELKDVSARLADSTTRLQGMRARRSADVRNAEAKLVAAKANLDLLERAEHRYLRVERATWSHGNSTGAQQVTEHERTEVIRAVDKLATIDLNVWNRIDVERAPLPLPIAWLEMLVPVPLPDIKEWVAEHYEEIDPDAPASAGVGASDLHRAYLQAHGLHASQCPLESFSAVVGEIFTRKRGNAKRSFMLQLKLTEAQKEARLRALFESEKAARERAEFAAWKASRAEAQAAK